MFVCICAFEDGAMMSKSLLTSTSFHGDLIQVSECQNLVNSVFTILFIHLVVVLSHCVLCRRLKQLRPLVTLC